MFDEPDELAAGLRELAEHEASVGGERFEDGLRQTMRWEQRRRRTQRRRLVAVGGLCAVFVALAVALALPGSARLLPLPVGGELRSLDAQTSDLQTRLSAQASSGRNFVADWRRDRPSPTGARWSPGVGKPRGDLLGLHAECLVVRLGLCAAYGFAEPQRCGSGGCRNARSEPESTVTERHAHSHVHADTDSDVAVTA